MMRTNRPKHRPTATAANKSWSASLAVIDQHPEILPNDYPRGWGKNRSTGPDHVRLNKVTDHLLVPSKVWTAARVTSTAEATAKNPNWSALSVTSDGPAGAGAVCVTVTVAVGSGVAVGVPVGSGSCVATAVGSGDGGGEVVADGSG